MKIDLSPQRRDDLLTVTKAGDVFTVNGMAFDFSALPDGRRYRPARSLVNGSSAPSNGPPASFT
ncbi:hypothetical protein ACVI1N_004199 [Sinorhizobium medicae]